MIIRIGCFVVPLIAAPLVMMGLRPLFAIFLREGAELFADIDLSKDLSAGIGFVLAQANVVLFLVAWWGAFACHLLDGTRTVSTLIALLGVALALLATVMIVRSRVGLQRQPALLVGLLAFAGGNLPLFLIVPAVLLFR